MSKLILASHGSLAEGMQSALRMILGETANEVAAFGLDTWDQPQAILEQIQKLREESKEEFIVLCDIKGGSVCNCMMQLCAEPNVCVISGMNLGLALELAMLSPETRCGEVIKELFEEAKKGIQYFDSSVIEKLEEGSESDELW